MLEEELKGASVDVGAIEEWRRKDAEYRGRLADLDAATQARNQVSSTWTGVLRASSRATCMQAQCACMALLFDTLLPEPAACCDTGHCFPCTAQPPLHPC